MSARHPAPSHPTRAHAAFLIRARTGFLARAHPAFLARAHPAFPTRAHPALPTRALLLLLATVLTAGCTGGSPTTPAAKVTPPAGAAPVSAATRPAAGAVPAPPPYWVNPDGKAARQLAVHLAAGRTAEAGLLRRIASRPMAEWIGSDRPEAETRALTRAATRAGREALLVLYDIPHRDCGQYSAGGAADPAAYRAWVDAVARGIGARRATVVLEPDAVMHVVDGCIEEQHHGERYELLKAAVLRLKQQPATTVYLDAGNAGWVGPAQLRGPLQEAGIAEADGFAVNVSNFQTTAASTAYGRQLSALLGGKPFVVDTSRNGNGPYAGGDPAQNWCNPPGRALGVPPTRSTGDPLVAAYLWIKRPGESDGECRGGPRAGEWFDAYALELAGNAR
ncbi:putative secreted endoglucanase [Streptomyces venezuelae]|nr:glycoside hydrolase family 6 protein [Streptomyces gardneri]ALO08638.1 putative secreted endoglucanase [Streptomyces venezuelae]QPK45835.1 glycoside hydrolase family 6 protein [Streptomyces gardneri]WRK37184.1 glycoside hydrolase family 6 protein [Streptomyces venezuelae]CUM40987.1 putative secreted endoglucanase [Streptomyces venezuelae]